MGRHDDLDSNGIADFAEHEQRFTSHASTPVAWGLDAAAALSVADVKAQGASFVCCYLAPSSQTWKVRSAAQIKAYIDAGLSVVFNWESDGTPGNGWSTGVSAAQQAQAQLNDRGWPNAPVIFTFADSGNPNLSAVLAAIQGAMSVLGWDRVGAYGGIDTIAYLADRKACKYFWQTYAWSSGRRDERAQLFQRLNGPQMDFDVAYATDFGQVPRPGSSSSTTTQAGVSEVAVQNFPHLTGRGRLVLGCPVGPGTFTSDAYVSLTVPSGYGSGHAYAQGTTAGVADWEHPASELTVNTSPNQRDTNLARRSARRVPAGTSVLEVDYDFTGVGPEGGTVTLETR